jgi:hypothetical protein
MPPVPQASPAPLAPPPAPKPAPTPSSPPLIPPPAPAKAPEPAGEDPLAGFIRMMPDLVKKAAEKGAIPPEALARKAPEPEHPPKLEQAAPVEPTTAPKPEPKLEPKPELKSETKSELKPEPKPELSLEPRQDVAPAPRSEPPQVLIPPAPAPQPPKTEEFKIVHDVAPRPSTPKITEPSAPPAAPPAPKVPAAPVPASPSVPTPVSAPPPVPDETKAAEDNELPIAFIYPPEEDAAKEEFQKRLIGIAREKAKKPLSLIPVFSQASPVSPDISGEWIRQSKAAGAQCLFVVMGRAQIADDLEPVVEAARESGLHCFLIPPADAGSKLLYVDLMVELMLVRKRK